MDDGGWAILLARSIDTVRVGSSRPLIRGTATRVLTVCLTRSGPTPCEEGGEEDEVRFREGRWTDGSARSARRSSPCALALPLASHRPRDVVANGARCGGEFIDCMYQIPSPPRVSGAVIGGAATAARLVAKVRSIRGESRRSTQQGERQVMVGVVSPPSTAQPRRPATERGGCLFSSRIACSTAV
jgi:hypothetical protein